MNPYLGHVSQLARVEEHRLIGGRGDGMRLFEMDNGIGTHLTVSADRCCDISRLSFRGVNLGYFSPCGYVSPAFYDPKGDGFLKSFTAGFLTTCGLQAVGTPCIDEGEELPLHGGIANTPAEQVSWSRDAGALWLTALICDERLFARKLVLHRTLSLSLQKNEFTLEDSVENTGGFETPFELLYHMNMGYPLLDEDSVVAISSERVEPRNAHAAEDMENWNLMEEPQPGYEERCYYHTCRKEGRAGIWQPKLSAGLEISFDPKQLDCFTEWKMMGARDYVLGLEPGNCYPDGRNVMRQKDILKFLGPGETMSYRLCVKFTTHQPM